MQMAHRPGWGSRRHRVPPRSVRRLVEEVGVCRGPTLDGPGPELHGSDAAESDLDSASGTVAERIIRTPHRVFHAIRSAPARLTGAPWSSRASLMPA